MNLPSAVTHICGHSGARTFRGSANHQALLARAFSERPCRDCFPWPDGFIPRVLLRAVDRAEIESRWLPPLTGDAEGIAAAQAVRACFVLALERYRSRGLFGPPGEEFEALLRVTLGADSGELKLRYAVVHDWLQDHGLEPEERAESLDLFAWHLGRIRLADERADVAWLRAARGYFGGPLDGALAFFARLNRPPTTGPHPNSSE